jgi:effector-binding domain-containing protein
MARGIFALNRSGGMKVQKIEAFTAICVVNEATISTIPEKAEQANAMIADEVARFGLQVVGPTVFRYTNMSQDMSKPFTLTIALPIANAEAYEGDLTIHAYEQISAVTSHYTGPIKDLAAKGYDPMMGYIKQNGLTMIDDCREVYHRWDGPDADTNDIELQIGVE